jgi:GT2 family glycosyltransferase
VTVTESSHEAAFETKPRVVIIILNTNRRDDTVECLASIARQRDGIRHHVILLDNRSTDGSADAVRAAFPDVEIIRIETDKGYAGNNNVGIKRALGYQPEWILVLNEDCVLDPMCLGHLVRAGDADRTVGMVGPMVFHHDEPGVIQSAGGRLGPLWESIHMGANEVNAGQFARIRQVDWLSGCALLVRRSVIDDIGMLDERFYYYWEETDWCVRTRKKGWRILHQPDARLWHKGVRRDYKPSPNVTYYNTRNRLLIISKHRPGLRIKLGVWGQVLRTAMSWTIRRRWRPLKAHRDAMWQGIGDFLQQRWGARPS